MPHEVLPAITAFGAKCGVEKDLFKDERFASDVNASGVSKGAGLARVAVWSAIKDVLQVHMCLTPGQVATIVDGAPIVVGESGLKELSECNSLQALSDFTREKAPDWSEAVVGLAQIWSLNRYVEGNTPDDYLYNSQFGPEHVAQVALAASFSRTGMMDSRNPAAMLDLLDTKTGLPAQLLERAKGGTVGSRPETDADKAATALHLAKDGQFDVLTSSGLLEPTRIEANQFLAANSKRECACNQGAFLGTRNLSELRNLGMQTPQAQETIESWFRSTPSGYYISLLTSNYDVEGTMSSELAMAGMQALSRSWDTFSPLFLAGQSITKVRQLQRTASDPQIDFFSDHKFVAHEPTIDPADGVDWSQKYRGSRIPAHMKQWVNKFSITLMQESKVVSVHPVVGKAVRQAQKIANGIQQETDCSYDDAVEEAFLEMEVSNEKSKKPIANYAKVLSVARLHLDHGGIISLDQQLSDSQRTRHETIGGAVDMGMIGDDRAEDWESDSSIRRPSSTPAEASDFEVVRYSPGSQTIELTTGGSIVDRFDILNDVFTQYDPESAKTLEEMAEAGVPSFESIDRMKSTLRSAFPQNAAVEVYTRMLDRTRDLLEEDPTPRQRELAMAGDGVGVTSTVAERLTHRLVQAGQTTRPDLHEKAEQEAGRDF